jgi:hypothetical protein
MHDSVVKVSDEGAAALPDSSEQQRGRAEELRSDEASSELWAARNQQQGHIYIWMVAKEVAQLVNCYVCQDVSVSV